MNTLAFCNIGCGIIFVRRFVVQQLINKNKQLKVPIKLNWIEGIQTEQSFGNYQIKVSLLSGIKPNLSEMLLNKIK